MSPISEQRGAGAGLPRLLLVLSLPYLAISLNNNGFLALLPFVREEFDLTRAQVGSYTTFFFISAALLAVFTGSLVDRLGARKGIIIGLSCMGSAMLLYGLVPSFPLLLGLPSLAGLGFSIITPSVNKGVLAGAPPGKRATSMGIMQSGIGIGGFAGASLLPVLGDSIGWRLSIQSTAAFALFIALMIYLSYRDDSSPGAPPAETEALGENLMSLLADHRILRVCCVGAVYGSMFAAAISHYTVFLSEDLQLTAALAGLGLGLVHVGGIAGRPLWGWLSDAVFQGDRPKTLFSVGLMIGGLYVLMGILAYGIHLPLPAVYIFSMLLGLTVLSWISVYFVTVGELADEARAGTATGLALVFNRVGMLLAPPIFGWLADSTGTYQISWILLGLIAAVAASAFYILTRRSHTSQTRHRNSDTSDEVTKLTGQKR